MVVMLGKKNEVTFSVFDFQLENAVNAKND